MELENLLKQIEEFCKEHESNSEIKGVVDSLKVFLIMHKKEVNMTFQEEDKQTDKSLMTTTKKKTKKSQTTAKSKINF